MTMEKFTNLARLLKLEKRPKIIINLLSFAWSSLTQLPLRREVMAYARSVAKTLTRSVVPAVFFTIVLWNIRDLIGNIISLIVRDTKVSLLPRSFNQSMFCLKGITQR
jgi:hypothetical protein